VFAVAAVVALVCAALAWFGVPARTAAHPPAGKQP